MSRKFLTPLDLSQNKIANLAGGTTAGDAVEYGQYTTDLAGKLSSTDPSVTNAWYLDRFTGTDDAKMASALAAWQASASGGTIVLAARTHTFTLAWQPMLSSFGGALFNQQPLRITGGGAGFNGRWLAPTGGTVCDFTYNTAGPAKIDTRGVGTIEIDHIFFRDLSGGNVPFFQTTNTTPKIHDCCFQGSKSGMACDQDALVLGGSAANTYDGSSNAAFQGYGGAVRDNYFHSIRRGIYGQQSCNSFSVINNTFSTACGATAATGAAIEFACSGSASYCTGNVIRDNVIEVNNYPYAIRLGYAVNNTLGPNGIWDPTSNHLAAYRFDPGAHVNLVIDGYRSDSYPLVSEDVSVANTNTLITAHQNQPTIYNQPVQVIGTPHKVRFAGSGSIAEDYGGNQSYWVTSAGNYPYPRAQVQVRPCTQVTDGVTTAGSNIVTSATAAFVSGDVGTPISGGSIGNGATILSVTNSTTVVMNMNATSTASGVTIRWGRLGAIMPMTIFERHHILSTGNVPSPSVTAAAGSGATISVAGTDLAGSVTLTTGTSPTSGLLCNIGYGINYSGNPRVSMTAKNTAAAQLVSAGMFASSTTANLSINAVSAPAPSTAHIFDWIIMQ